MSFKYLFRAEKKILRPLLLLAWPIILANLFQAAYQLTDAFWVGRLGEKAVAAISVSFPIAFFIISLGTGLAIAGAILTAQYFGAKNEKMVSHSAAQTMLMVVVAALFLSSIGYLSAPTILQWLQVDNSIIDMASSYLRISFIGIVFNFSFFMFQAIMRSIGRPQFPVYIVIGTVILNFFLDPLFMFGRGPIPAFGVSGTAIATVITQSLAAIIGLLSLFAGKRGIKLHLADFKPDWPFIVHAFKLGLPASIEQSSRSLELTVMTGLVASFGTLAIAAYGVSGNVLHLALMLSFGIAGANSALVGQKLGANKPEEADQVARLSLKLIFTFLLLAGILTFIFAPALITFFIPNDPAVIVEGARLVRFIATAFALIGLQIIVGSTLQAAGSTSQAMKLSIISQWLVQLPLAFLLSKALNLGITGVWLTFPITNIIMSTIYLFVFFKGKWKTKKIISHEQKTEIKVLQETEVEEIITKD